VDFVHSPYFNKHERLMAMADYLYAALTEPDGAELSKEAIFAYLFPAEAYHEQRMADLQSYLVKLLERFLAQHHLEQHPFHEQYHLMAELAQRNLDKQYLQAFRGLEKQQEKRTHRNEDFFLHQYMMWNESDHFFMRQQQRTRDESLQQKVDALDLFYLTAKLKNACEMVNREHVISVNYNYWLTEELLNYLRDNIADYQAYPPIVVYYHILLTLMEPDDPAHYPRLKGVLNDARPYFQQPTATAREREEVRYMYLYVQNHCIHQINRGHPEFLRELFELYKWLLESEIIFEGEYLSQWDYKNIVTAGHRLEEYSWTEQFIYEYRDRLHPEVRENAFNYNLATLALQQKDYRKALKVLQEVQFSDVYYALGGRVLLARIYYETRDFEPLFSLMDSFQIFIKRNKSISEYQQKLHLNFIKMLRKLTTLRSKLPEEGATLDKKLAEKLQASLNTTPEVAASTWLRAKVRELSPEELRVPR
jgi:hypothetical protein